MRPAKTGGTARKKRTNCERSLIDCDRPRRSRQQYRPFEFNLSATNSHRLPAPVPRRTTLLPAPVIPSGGIKRIFPNSIRAAAQTSGAACLSNSQQRQESTGEPARILGDATAMDFFSRRAGFLGDANFHVSNDGMLHATFGAFTRAAEGAAHTRASCTTTIRCSRLSASFCEL